MVPVVNRPALYHILRLLAAHGIRDVVVNLHHFPDTIRSYFGDGEELGIRLRYSYEEELLGTAGGVKNNEEFLTAEGTFLVMSGDSLTDLDLDALVEAHRSLGVSATLALKEVDDPSQYGVVVQDDDNCVHSFQEKPAREEALSHLCNCGIYVLEPEALARVPAHSVYDFGKQLWPSMIADGERIGTFALQGYWNDVGDLQEYLRGNFAALAGEVRLEIPGRESSDRVWVDRHTLIKMEADVRAPVLIGPDCWVEDGAEIIGPAILGGGCVVEAGARVAGSVAWGGAYFAQGSSVTGCIVGRAARIGAGAQAEGSVLGERCLVEEGALVVSESVDARAEFRRSRG
jgi:mannose-1-phosphate guanylyltransferase/phosphomannomutase